MDTFTQILVPTSFDEPSQRALNTAIALAQKLDASLTLLHVYELPVYTYYGTVWPTDFVASVETAARLQLEQTLSIVQRQVRQAHSLLRQGVPWQEILAQISEARADLVVIGTHGRQGLSRALLGSVAERVVRTSPVPVLTVRATES